MATDRAAPGWTVVLPVKGGDSAKSRLAVPDRISLARAVALDTVAAVTAADGVVQRVLVVTGDARAAAEHAALGATVVADPGPDLAAALRAGLEAAGRQAPERPCAVLLADLPALTADDVRLGLAACADALASGARQVTVPDADGTGTTLLAAASPAVLTPSFGAGSAGRHAVVAHVLTDVPWALRHDVDTAHQLDAVLAHGAGPRTRAVVAGPARDAG
ncbi:2-phospho-L-lactate guanylyltransferase [Aquipuribacter nitratireducens]|uniref:Phosphoenolpyruvate guanylyltransferase n=1 Tax=Aquipuribacter nitratireducens TaxID=650104 RepID=A0ABW0GKM0_9MICO